MKRLLLLFLSLLISKTIILALTVNHLRVESQVNPAIDSTPHFSWWLHSDKRGCLQLSYQIQIYDDEKMTSKVFDSGVKESEESQRVVADGFSMTPSTRYYWRVTVRDNLGEEATSSDCAYFDSGMMDTGWSGAHWIMYPEEGDKSTGMPRFRKVFILSKPVRSAYIYSSALGIYDLKLNGERVGHAQSDNTVQYDELKPGWTDFRKTIYYNVHEISHYLHEGANVIGADVTNGWWNGEISWGLYGGYPLGFIAKIHVNYVDGTNEIVITDTSWKTTLNSPYIMGDIYNGEIYDARLEDDWQKINYDDENWKSVIQNTYFSGDIVIQAAGQVRLRHDYKREAENIVIYEGVKEDGSDFGSINPIKTASGFTPFTLNKGQTAIFDFGQNTVGYVKISFVAPKGTEVRLRYAEMLNDSGSKERGNDGPGGSLYLSNLRTAKATSYYYCSGAEKETYCPVMTYFGFRYCEVTADETLIVESIEAIPISSVVGDISDIRTDNTYINKLFSNIKWGQLGNFVSVPTDCPQRNERWGWTGDTQVFSRTGMYNTSAEPFYRKYLSDLRDSQREDGAYPDCAPYTQLRPYGNAGWSEAGIIIPWNIYMMYGNRDVLSEHYNSMEKYMDYLSTQTTDGIKYAGPGTEYGDWLAYEKCDNRYVSMAYYANDAKLMSQISAILSLSENDEFSKKSIYYKELYESIREEFISKYWTPIPNDNTQTTYLLPLAFELLDKEKTTNAIQLLNDNIVSNEWKLSTGFLGTALLLPTLSKYGQTDAAYNLLLQRSNPSWLYSIDQGATTIWERWDSYTKEKGFGPATMNSFNHYAYGAVGEWLYRYMVGIEIDLTTPGFKHFYLSPTIDSRTNLPDGGTKIKEVSATYNSSYGDIDVYWLSDGTGIETYNCRIPANTTATLILPVNSDHEDYFEDGRLASLSEGIKLIDETAHEKKYLLESGYYRFSKGESPATIINVQKERLEQICLKDGIILLNDDTIEEVIIYDSFGRILQKKEGHPKIVSISGYKKGVYLLELRKLAGNLATKFVVD